MGWIHIQKIYQPTAISSPVWKIIEYGFLNSLIEFISKNNVLEGEQHCFGRGKCKNTAILSYIYYVQKRLVKGEVVYSLFNISKTSDSVNQSILLNHMENYGVRRMSKWSLRSFLEIISLSVKVTHKGHALNLWM